MSKQIQCHIYTDCDLKHSYSLRVMPGGLVNIGVSDPAWATPAFAESLLHKHRRFIQRRIELQKQCRGKSAPPLPTVHQAAQKLQPEYLALASQMKLPPWPLRFSAAKTRWGSASHRTGLIMLNLQVFHLPLKVRRYLMIHELCHIRHRGHQPSFWQMVAKYDSDYQKHRHILRNDYAYLLSGV